MLLSLVNKDEIDFINTFLPYSTGFEIECDQRETFDESSFRKIPNILDVRCDSGEQRFRIPNGLNGILCLYNISNQLVINSKINNGSGIHYHINCSDIWDLIYRHGVTQLNQFACQDSPSVFITDEDKENLLKELDAWKYKGTYNSRRVDTSHSWIRINSEFKTMEIRIGEMTFNYQQLIKRIVHANSIIRTLKRKLLKERYSEHYSYVNLDIIRKYIIQNPISKQRAKTNNFKEVQNRVIKL